VAYGIIFPLDLKLMLRTPAVKIWCPRCLSIVAVEDTLTTGANPDGPGVFGTLKAEMKPARLASIPASAASLIVSRARL
jgi:hypothetical protein